MNLGLLNCVRNAGCACVCVSDGLEVLMECITCEPPPEAACSFSSWIFCAGLLGEAGWVLGFATVFGCRRRFIWFSLRCGLFDSESDMIAPHTGFLVCLGRECSWSEASPSSLGVDHWDLFRSGLHSKTLAAMIARQVLWIPPIKEAKGIPPLDPTCLIISHMFILVSDGFCICLYFFPLSHPFCHRGFALRCEAPHARCYRYPFVAVELMTCAPGLFGCWGGLTMRRVEWWVAWA